MRLTVQIRMRNIREGEENCITMFRLAGDAADNWQSLVAGEIGAGESRDVANSRLAERIAAFEADFGLKCDRYRDIYVAA